MRLGVVEHRRRTVHQTPRCGFPALVPVAHDDGLDVGGGQGLDRPAEKRLAVDQEALRPVIEA
jgi:hypothetical protein